MDRRVVITGMGIVSPIGCDVDTYRQNLLSGVCGIDRITRFDTADFKVKVAAEVKDFDPLAYMTKMEVKQTDLFTRYAIAAAVQAMDMSGLKDAVDCTRFGVYFGSGIGGFTTFMEEYDVMQNRGNARVSPHFVPKMISNIAAGQIAIRFGAKGPCLPVTTACATGTNAIGEGYRAIRHGYADAVIAGGSEASINPLAVAGFQNCMALTQTDDPARASIPFDKNRSGFVIGEGAGALVMESLEHAEARGAKILAEVVGYGSTCDAYHVTSPDPEGTGGGRAIRMAMEEAGYTAADRVYINAHGTSTPLNDSTETKAIKFAMGEDAYKAVVSSTKSMTGHMLGAAGAAEAIASVTALETGLIPPTIGYETPDPACDLDVCPNTARQATPTLALSVSLGFGGHNACIALRKYGGQA
ncbi:MAG: beta-ketoacyl-ACP synthase II [Clostridia bacterium]|nr:beta-ketoacyl-ACP synthase II [Clostridia bacterium]